MGIEFLFLSYSIDSSLNQNLQRRVTAIRQFEPFLPFIANVKFDALAQYEAIITPGAGLACLNSGCQLL